MSEVLSNIMIIYLITLIVSIVYYLYKSDEVNFRINFELKNRGLKKNKGSLLDISDYMKGLIPFYTVMKCNKLLNDKKSLNDFIDSKVLSGHFKNTNSNNDIYVDDVSVIKQPDNSLFRPLSKVAFEEVEPYKARRIDVLEGADEYHQEEDVIKPVSASLNEQVNSEAYANVTPFMTRTEEENKDTLDREELLKLSEYINSMLSSDKDIEVDLGDILKRVRN